MDGLLWPSRWLTTFTGTPASSRIDAPLCRKACKGIRRQQVCAIARSNSLLNLSGLAGRPSGCAKTSAAGVASISIDADPLCG